MTFRWDTIPSARHVEGITDSKSCRSGQPARQKIQPHFADYLAEEWSDKVEYAQLDLKTLTPEWK